MPLLRAHPDVHLVAVGPGGKVDWAAAQEQVPGRIRLVAETLETATYLDAADIYLDSFPSCRSPRSSRRASGVADRLPLPVRGRVRGHGGGLAGLDTVLLRAETVEEYRAAIETLIADPARRTALGAATRERIEQSCMGDGWRAGLGEVYRSAAAAHLRRQPRVWEEPGPGDLDWFIPFAYGNEAMGASKAGRLAGAMEFVLKAGPLWWRSSVLLRMAATGDLRALPSPWRFLIPEWLGRQARRHIPRRG